MRKNNHQYLQQKVQISLEATALDYTKVAQPVQFKFYYYTMTGSKMHLPDDSRTLTGYLQLQTSHLQIERSDINHEGIVVTPLIAWVSANTAQ